MRVHSNTTPMEFVELLYYALSSDGFPPAWGSTSTPCVLDCVNKLRDALEENADLKRDLDECQNTPHAADAHDLYDELRCLVQAFDGKSRMGIKSAELASALQMARSALERHKEYA